MCTPCRPLWPCGRPARTRGRAWRTVLDRSQGAMPAAPLWTLRTLRSSIVDTSGQRRGCRRGASRRIPNNAPGVSMSVLIRRRMLVSVARRSAPEVLFTRLLFSLEHLQQRERQACWLCTSTAPSPSSSPSFSTLSSFVLAAVVGTLCVHACHVTRRPGGVSKMEYNQEVWD